MLISSRIRNTSAEVKKEIELQIGHVLFIDVVGYSKLSINDQNVAIDELTQIVPRNRQSVFKTEARGLQK